MGLVPYTLAETYLNAGIYSLRLVILCLLPLSEPGNISKSWSFYFIGKQISPDVKRCVFFSFVVVF